MTEKWWWDPDVTTPGGTGMDEYLIMVDDAGPSLVGQTPYRNMAERIVRTPYLEQEVDRLSNLISTLYGMCMAAGIIPTLEDGYKAAGLEKDFQEVRRLFFAPRPDTSA